MPRLTRLTPDTAVGASRDLLAELASRHGQIGDMVSTMAHSPAVLGGYLQLSRAMGRAKLDREITDLDRHPGPSGLRAVSRRACQRCPRAMGVDEEEIERARAGTSADPAIAAIITLALQVYREPTSITDDQFTALRAHGYSDRAIADVVGVVALNILTGAFNLLAGLTPESGTDA